MVARIAPSPITSAVASSDAFLHASDAAPNLSLRTQRNEGGSNADHARQDVAANTQLNTLPVSPPGEAFAAAVIAGQLPPRPISPEQLRQRLGSAWQPPASPFRLMDRSA